jgi:hypothetical protein
MNKWYKLVALVIILIGMYFFHKYLIQKLPLPIIYEFNNSMNNCMKNGVKIEPDNEQLVEAQYCKKIIKKHNYEPKKIAIVSMFITDSKVPHYANETKKILQNYCTKHGYDLYYFDDVIDKNYTMMWQKQNAVKKVMDLNIHDYVMWIDADIIIMNDNIPIENFIDLNKNKDIYLSKDIKTNDFWSFRWCVHHYMNAGIFILKNSVIGKQYLQEILDHYTSFNGYFKENFFHEQSIMQYLYFKKYYPYALMIPHTVLQTIYSQNIQKEGDFALHMAGDSVRVRNNAINAYLNHGIKAIPTHNFGFWI